MCEDFEICDEKTTRRPVFSYIDREENRQNNQNISNEKASSNCYPRNVLTKKDTKNSNNQFY